MLQIPRLIQCAAVVSTSTTSLLHAKRQTTSNNSRVRSQAGVRKGLDYSNLTMTMERSHSMNDINRMTTQPGRPKELDISAPIDPSKFNTNQADHSPRQRRGRESTALSGTIQRNQRTTHIGNEPGRLGLREGTTISAPAGHAATDPTTPQQATRRRRSTSPHAHNLGVTQSKGTSGGVGSLGRMPEQRNSPGLSLSSSTSVGRSNSRQKLADVSVPGATSGRDALSGEVERLSRQAGWSRFADALGPGLATMAASEAKPVVSSASIAGRQPRQRKGGEFAFPSGVTSAEGRTTASAGELGYAARRAAVGTPTSTGPTATDPTTPQQATRRRRSTSPHAHNLGATQSKGTSGGVGSLGRQSRQDKSGEFAFPSGVTSAEGRTTASAGELGYAARRAAVGTPTSAGPTATDPTTPQQATRRRRSTSPHAHNLGATQSKGTSGGVGSLGRMPEQRNSPGLSLSSSTSVGRSNSRQKLADVSVPGATSGRDALSGEVERLSRQAGWSRFADALGPGLATMAASEAKPVVSSASIAGRQPRQRKGGEFAFPSGVTSAEGRTTASAGELGYAARRAAVGTPTSTGPTATDPTTPQQATRRRRSTSPAVAEAKVDKSHAKVDVGSRVSSTASHPSTIAEEVQRLNNFGRSRQQTRGREGVDVSASLTSRISGTTGVPGHTEVHRGRLTPVQSSAVEMDPATAVRERRRRKGKDAVLEGVQLPSNERLPAGPALRQLTQQATRETRMGPAVAPFPHLKEPQVAVPGSRLEVAKAKGKKEPLSKTEKAEVPVRAEARGEQVPASKSVISAAAERAPSSPTVVSSTSTSKVNDAATTAAALSNPFRGLHEHISRSYRLDQLQAVMQPNDLLLGRQESKTGAFSFIRFACGQDFLNDHRASGFPSLHSPTNPDGGAAKSNSGRKGSKKKDASENDCLLVVAERLLAFPQNMRNFHTVCGRENVPCDFFADIDLPNETQASGEKILLEVLNYLDVRLQGIGFMRPSFIILTNEVPSADKVSYHVHARAMGKSGEEDESDAFGSVKQNGLNGDHDSKKSKANKPTGKTIAFQDYRVVKLLADEVNLALGRTIIDEQCYRNNGMLRCAFSTKINAPGFSPLSTPPSDATGAVGQQKGKRLVPLRKAKDPALQKRLDEMSIHLGELSDAQILERTFCIRTAPVSGRLLSSSEDGVVQKISTDKKDEYLRSFKLIRARHILGPQSKQAVEYDAYGNVVSVYLTEAAKWRRFKTVVEKLRRLPPRSAESYDIWVRVGLALHNFSNEDHVFEEWVRFSLKCPQKYSRESCRRKWQQFERNPDALNWRRGFNYLNSTIWRSVHGLY